MATVIHQELAVVYYHSKTIVIITEIGKLYWDVAVNTDRTVQHSGPITMLLDGSLYNRCKNSMNENVEKTYQEKISKYSPQVDELKECNFWTGGIVHNLTDVCKLPYSIEVFKNVIKYVQINYII